MWGEHSWSLSGDSFRVASILCSPQSHPLNVWEGVLLLIRLQGKVQKVHTNLTNEGYCVVELCPSWGFDWREAVAMIMRERPLRKLVKDVME